MIADKPPRFIPQGDTGLAIDFGEHIDRDISRHVLALQARIHDAALAGIIETVPTFRSLLLHLDPDAADIERIRSVIEPMLTQNEADDAPARHWSVPVCYEPALAPDIETVAERTGLTPAQVVDAHSSAEYHVYMIGFLPGYPYLGDLAPELVLPRRNDPRLEVPAGSVAIATTLTAIYPVASPGGWHLIGRTPVGLFDPDITPPALLRPGDKVTFHPIGHDEFTTIETARRERGYVLHELDPKQ